MDKERNLISSTIRDINEEYSRRDDKKNYEELVEKTMQLCQMMLQEKKSSEKEGSDNPTETPENRQAEIHTLATTIKQSFRIMENRATKKVKSAYIPTGYELLDAMIGGWEPGELIVIGSRPSVGKTSLALSMVRNMAVEREIPCAYITYETGIEHLTDRIIAAETEIPISKIKHGKIQDSDWIKLDKDIRDIIDKKIYLVSDPLLDPDGLHDTIKRLAEGNHVKLVVLDYLQLIMPYRQRRNREQEISTLIRKISSMAKEFNVVILLLSQLNRSVEVRSGDKRPWLSDLRASGSIEDDADKVIFLHRPEVYGIMEDEMGNSVIGIAELIIAKNRTGPTGELPLRFKAEFGKFEQLKINHEALGDIRPQDILDGEVPF